MLVILGERSAFAATLEIGETAELVAGGVCRQCFAVRHPDLADRWVEVCAEVQDQAAAASAAEPIWSVYTVLGTRRTLEAPCLSRPGAILRAVAVLRRWRQGLPPQGVR